MTSKKRSKVEMVAGALMAAAPKVFEHELKRTPSCITGTAVTLRVCKHFKVDAIPLTVRVAVFNPRLVELLDQLGEWPERELLDHWIATEGARATGMGRIPDHAREDARQLPPNGGGPGWSGHLVSIFRPATARPFLVDLTLPQINAPEHHIQLTAVALPVTMDFVRGVDDPGRPVVGMMNGCVLKYEPDIENRDYVIAPAWLSLDLNRRCAVRIIAMMERMLGVS